MAAIESSGAIALAGPPSTNNPTNSVELQLGLPGTAAISMNCTNVRTLAGIPSGQISLGSFYGKSNNWPGTISSNQTNLNLYSWATSNGYPGSGNAQITIAPGVYVYSTNVSCSALSVPSSFPPGSLTLINNGYIMGAGGAGQTASLCQGSLNPGGVALSIATPITLTNNSFIGGGGGAGGNSERAAGGGGAGGGCGGAVVICTTYPGGVASTAGAAGNPGPSLTPTAYRAGTGGAGGRVDPGTGGAGGIFLCSAAAQGGGAGGGGGAWRTYQRTSPPKEPALYVVNAYAGGGGGGWGAAGGASRSWGEINTNIYTPSAVGGAGGAGNAAGGIGTTNMPAYNTCGTSPGAAGGKAIALNGNSITYPASGTIWGTVS
jgi:hypothetical protein